MTTRADVEQALALVWEDSDKAGIAVCLDSPRYAIIGLRRRLAFELEPAGEATQRSEDVGRALRALLSWVST